MCDVFIQILFMCIYYVYVCTIYIKYTYFMHIFWCFVVFYTLYMQYIHILYSTKILLNSKCKTVFIETSNISPYSSLYSHFLLQVFCRSLKHFSPQILAQVVFNQYHNLGILDTKKEQVIKTCPVVFVVSHY